jgi:hypothetical protein
MTVRKLSRRTVVSLTVPGRRGIPFGRVNGQRFGLIPTVLKCWRLRRSFYNTRKTFSFPSQQWAIITFNNFSVPSSHVSEQKYRLYRRRLTLNNTFENDQERIFVHEFTNFSSITSVWLDFSSTAAWKAVWKTKPEKFQLFRVKSRKLVFFIV